MTKKIIIMTAAGLVSFAGAFVFGWLTHPSPASPPDKSEEPAPGVAGAQSEQRTAPQPEPVVTEAVDTASSPMKKAMTEQQLKNLVQDIREKMREYDNRLQALTVREQRLQVAQDVLKEDINNLNNLRVELASTVANLKSERDKLLKSRLEIDQAEKVNLASIAATYDKMDASSAGKILANMCAAGGDKAQSTVAGKADGSFDDAVKILYYMTERTKAKLLAELAASEPQLAAVLSRRLRQIAEKQ
jgi:flagellar motility protein MotE (MotC chaperone)